MNAYPFAGAAPLVVELKLTEDERLFDEADYLGLRLARALKPFAEVAEHDIDEHAHASDLFKPLADEDCHAPLLRVSDFREALRVIKEWHDREWNAGRCREWNTSW